MEVQVNKKNLSVRCKLCGEEFDDGRGLTSHLRNKHSEFPILKAKGRNPINGKNSLLK
jgi:hypothetical protein